MAEKTPYGLKRKVKDFLDHMHDGIDDSDKAGEYIDQALPRIGEVIMNFNRLEKTLDEVICTYISSAEDTLGTLIIHGMGFAAKVSLLERLADEHHRMAGLWSIAYGKLIGRLKDAAQARNAVAHADWINTTSDGFTHTKSKVTKADGVEQEYFELTVPALELIVDNIWSVTDQLEEFQKQRDNR